MRGLRHYAAHYNLPLAVAEFTVQVDSTLLGRIMLRIPELREHSKYWKPKGKRYMASMPDQLDVAVLFADHKASVIKLFDWLADRQNEIHRDELDELELILLELELTDIEEELELLLEEIDTDEELELEEETLLELVDMEIRELLSKYDFDGDNIPVIYGSASEAMNNPDDPEKTKCIQELMDALDSYIPEPEREVDKPFLMPIEDVFSIKGRGTVGTGRIERGTVHVGEEIEIIGITETRKAVVTGVEMLNKTLNDGQAGDNVGCLLRGVEKNDLERGCCMSVMWGRWTSWLKYASEQTL